MSEFYLAICSIVKLLSLNNSNSNDILVRLQNETDEAIKLRFEQLVKNCSYAILQIIANQDEFKSENVILSMRKVLLERRREIQLQEHIIFKHLNRNCKYIIICKLELL